MGARTLGIRAERNAIFHMLTCGEDSIRRVVAVDWDGSVMPPCGACRDCRAACHAARSVARFTSCF